MTQLFHPLLALIASATDKELAKYVQSRGGPYEHFDARTSTAVESHLFCWQLDFTHGLGQRGAVEQQAPSELEK